jgi:hypothetical protein
MRAGAVLEACIYTQRRELSRRLRADNLPSSSNPLIQKTQSASRGNSIRSSGPWSGGSAA